MGNTSSERSCAGDKAHMRESRGAKDGAGPKILMNSAEDGDLFQAEDAKEFLAWQQDQESVSKVTPEERPTVLHWNSPGKEIYMSGLFNKWASKIPLTKSYNYFVAIIDLPEGEHQYKYYVDGHWVLDPKEPVVTNKLGVVNNVIKVRKTDFEVFDALKTDSTKCEDMSDLSSSPPGPSCQEPYSTKSEDRFRSPPILPPHPLQVLLNKDTGVSCDPTLLPESNLVMLNHLYALSIKDGVMVLSAAHHYKKKYVTTSQSQSTRVNLCKLTSCPKRTNIIVSEKYICIIIFNAWNNLPGNYSALEKILADPIMTLVWFSRETLALHVRAQPDDPCYTCKTKECFTQSLQSKPCTSASLIPYHSQDRLLSQK